MDIKELETLGTDPVEQIVDESLQSSSPPPLPPPVETLDSQTRNDETLVAVETETLEKEHQEEKEVKEEGEEEEKDSLPSSLNFQASADFSLSTNYYSSSWTPWPKSTPSFLTFYSNEPKPSSVVAGLTNLGNTCFLNSILQCFTHSAPFVEGIRSLNHKSPCDRSEEGFCVLCALRDHIELSLSSAGDTISPVKLVENLNYFSSSFHRYQQEDAHEFLQSILDRLDSCCLDIKQQNKDSSSEDSFVSKIFGGRLLSQLRCCNCGHCSDTYEPLIDLSLEIEEVDNLSSALQSFTKVERIEDPDIKFTCENCKQEVAVEKQLKLDHAPSIATFHLKRFKNDGSYVEKIDKHLDFPLELDLQPFTTGEQKSDVNLKYGLYAVVEHVGYSSNSGHYFCFVRSALDTWHRLDDAKVYTVPADNVLSREAYILFYARQGIAWISSLMEAQKQCFVSHTSPKSVLDDVEGNYDPYKHGVRTSNYEVEQSCNTVEISPDLSGRPGGDVPCVNENMDDTFWVCTPTPLGESNHCQPVENVDQICSTSLRENTCSPGMDEARKEAHSFARLLSRSPSADIYGDELPEISYTTPQGHLKPENQLSSCKELSSQAMNDSPRREAARLIRSMPSSRSAKLMAAMTGPQSEKSASKKKTKRKLEASLNECSSSPNVRQKENNGSVRRAVSAGCFHEDTEYGVCYMVLIKSRHQQKHTRFYEDNMELQHGNVE
ncbi:Peptidase C19, ubiquitin carboxyl-terminal hydrolase [Dillenia turbinata]|uniref:Ubiquitin carboxyl-terminal hydrolase n=1 Tax=Dillenia turbinata TaxID=194707 RepID=A0AAN8W7I3_9MAGN